MAEQRSLAFVGGGNMASSLIGGLVNAGWDPQRITVAEPDRERRQGLANRFGVQTNEDNASAVAAADTVVLAVKPQILPEVCAGLASALGTGKPLVISIAAGVRLDSLRRWLGAPVPLVRAMPNTPALVGAGVSALCAGEDVDTTSRTETERILCVAGEVVWVPKEDQMDVVTALSGSGPAYFFLIMEALEEAAVAEGLDRENARILAAETAAGAAALAKDSSDLPAVLRTRVTSPGGTTAQGLAALERGGLRSTLAEAISAAAARSRELGG